MGESNLGSKFKILEVTNSDFFVGDKVKVYLTNSTEPVYGTVMEVGRGIDPDTDNESDYIVVNHNPVGENAGQFNVFRKLSNGVYVDENGSTI